MQRMSRMRAAVAETWLPEEWRLKAEARQIDTFLTLIAQFIRDLVLN
jgi:hypothetical protein